MKKLMLTMIMTMMLFVNVLAGDIPESVMMENDIDVIIATITEIQEKQATIQVEKTFFEIVTDETVVVQDFEYLVGSGVIGTVKLVAPKVGDYCAVAVFPKDESLIVYGGLCAKADSLEATTLKLDGGNEFIERMNEYINTGYYSKENRYNIASGQRLSLPTNTPVPMPQKEISNPNYYLYGIIGTVVLGVICLLVFRKRK